MTIMQRPTTGATEAYDAGDARRARLLVPSVVAAMVLLSSASFVIFPLIPSLQGSLGVSTAEVGYLAAAGFAAALIAELLVAPAADRGHARLMAVIGVLMVAGSLGLSAAATEGWQLIAGRAVGGFGFGIFVIAASALIVRFDHARSGELLGRLGAAELAGIAVGPLGSGLALSFAGPSAILAVAAVVVLVALVPVLVGFREASASATRGGGRDGRGHPRTESGADGDATGAPGDRSLGDDPHPRTGGIAAGVLGFDGTDADRSLRFGSSAPKTSLDLLRSPRIVGIVLLYAAVMVPTGAYDGVWPRFMADIGADPVLTALSYALFAVPYVLVAGWAGRLADRRGGVSAYARGMLILLPIVTLYGFVGNPFIATGMGFVESTGQALAFIGAAAAMAHGVDPARAGSAQGLLRGIGLAAATVAAAVSGLAYELGGALLLFGGTAVAVAVIAAVGLLLARSRRGRAPSR